MNVTDTARRAQLLRDLHVPGTPLILYNVWDAAGAALLEALGCGAVATGSASIAAAQGFPDGEQMGRDEMLRVVARVTAATRLPVSADLESGYGASAEDVAETVRLAIAAGAAGMNIEDSSDSGLRSQGEQCARIRAAREAAEALGVPFVINARLDAFLRAADERDVDVPTALDRAKAYRDAGADCIYPIWLSHSGTIQEFVTALDAPINVYARPGIAPLSTLASLGIARVSFGPFPQRDAMEHFRRSARAVYEDARYPWDGTA